MRQTIAVIGPGRMGSALGAQLTRAGYRVITSLEGRGEASRARAAQAGMESVAEADLGQAVLVLSVVPPAEALPVAQRLRSILLASATKPIVADLNAISPDTVRLVEAEIVAAGCPFADGCIIGTPPAPGYDGPYLYFSGPAARDVMTIVGNLAIWSRFIDGDTGAASALKMCFGGVMKGLTSIGITMMLAAEGVGAGNLMAEQLARSEPELWAWFNRRIPASYAKHGRWVAEMEEIAGFLAGEGDAGGAAQFQAHAVTFGRLAGSSDETQRLAALLEDRPNRL